MAEVYVRNSLNPHKLIKVGISFIQTVDYSRHDGELIWALEVGTPEPHYNGGKITPVYVTNFNLHDIDKEIEQAVTEVSSKVDWGSLESDVEPPYINVLSPTNYIVDMTCAVDFILKEVLPSAGIDEDSISVEVNGIDVSEELYITGDPFEYRVIWHPKRKVFDTYV